MNEQLQGKLVEILSGIQSATKAAGDFAMEQLPDIAQQYVMFGRVSLTFYFFASFAVITGAVFAAHRWRKESDGVSYVIAVCVSIPSGIVFLLSANSFFLVWFAPKVWLLKELASLIK